MRVHRRRDVRAPQDGGRRPAGRSFADNLPNGDIAGGRVLDDDEHVLISDAEIDSGLVR
jgi:hypothetical protein